MLTAHTVITCVQKRHNKISSPLRTWPPPARLTANIREYALHKLRSVASRYYVAVSAFFCVCSFTAAVLMTKKVVLPFIRKYRINNPEYYVYICYIVILFAGIFCYHIYICIIVISCTNCRRKVCRLLQMSALLFHSGNSEHRC